MSERQHRPLRILARINRIVVFITYRVFLEIDFIALKNSLLRRLILPFIRCFWRVFFLKIMLKNFETELGIGVMIVPT